MTDQMKSLIEDMGVSVVNMALYVSDEAHSDLAQKWHALKLYLEASPDTRECPMVPGEVCKMN
jgi:hypothetical protein